ncbi:hypothetical protein BJ508DRAFT_32198 [Ascobolus immersus RN42]|uniref:Uncharacterized protein n=1 Tax=Ascobolus immersus RN42 TaxID=1160509 RepID=A0A3N4IIN8_ASCIM|nr:hypothetical protein BJ508DRAFT_32198 [Ascobolus immersus RN42]
MKVCSEPGYIDQGDLDLMERLGQALTRRRQTFLYWRSHREKLSRGLSHRQAADDMQEDVRRNAGLIQQPVAMMEQPKTESVARKEDPVIQSRIAAISVSQRESAMQTNTTATSGFVYNYDTGR